MIGQRLFSGRVAVAWAAITFTRKLPGIESWEGSGFARVDPKGHQSLLWPPAWPSVITLFSHVHEPPASGEHWSSTLSSIASRR